jgi:serine/threonine protein kinase
LLDEFRNIKLGDFGLSGTMKDGEFMKTPCGSANYAAPEIVSGQKYAGTEVDVWSLGVLLFTLLAGSLPFDEASMPLLISKIKEARFRIPYHFTAQAADLIKRMIVVNPLHRLSITEILRHPWISSTFPQSPLITPCPITIDEEIFTILFSFPQFSLEEKKEEKRQKILSFDYSDLFSVSYFMLLHQKRKNQGHTTCSKRVFKQVNLTSKLLTAPNTWKFCFHLEDSLEKVIENICKTLKALNCFWKFSTPFYMKIVKKNLYKKIYLKFELRVYIADNVKEGKKFLVDFRLLTGCSLTFLDFCSEFFALSKCILS